MGVRDFNITSKVWLYEGGSPWHFATIQKEIADDIKKFDIGLARRGFGSVPVMVTIGKTTWKTSIFPDKNGNYVLPIKKEVRKKESIKVDDDVRIFIALV